jgi:hypothetical protein
VSPTDALEMIHLTPTQRLEWLSDNENFADARSTVTSLLGQYEKFLETTNVDETTLIERFKDKTLSHEYMGAAYKFGDLTFHVLNLIGKGNRFHRLLAV